MKKLILFFITLTTFINISNASFPITENNTVLTTTNFDIDHGDDDDKPDWSESLLFQLLILLASGFVLYKGLKTGGGRGEITLDG
jgi:hypothetical protein|tara:strand:+ start:127 stop:381 length:255 start_codon:yes stop_codon:yes gene_type:complete